ncbi:flagellar hook protein FlgE [Peribacillus asahii]|uniref:Flagellar hook protein FlgE n=1 Tax=Peribacillus asahii TaxID=228899 RepID=A0A3Q9RM02_9BACI|nr:flagellar hook protein FlgE [Peribacillus asahii]AZV42278.1 flagellar hook protein [Peribacillus asahii]USK86587.1 flagellar hook protein FlgE [Peribacillus asahii]
MLRSMYSGISGLKNMQTKLDVIGNNIANVNTYGFKKSRVTFSDTMNQTIAGASAATENRGGTNAKQIGLGSAIASIDTLHTQSSLQNTSRDQDLAISGDGYFLVKNGEAEFYTRAGNFYLDDKGTLVTSDGLKVQAFKVDADGDVTNNYGDVSVNVNALMPAVATDKITFKDNLSADSTSGAASVFTQQIKVTNDQGEYENLTVYFMKSATAANTWGVYLNDPSKSSDAVTGGPSAANYKIKDITFQADGTINSTAASGTLTVRRWSDGVVSTTTTYPTTPAPTPAPTIISTSRAINLDFTNLTQKAGVTTALVNPNGSTQGKLESFNFGSSGEINGVYSNGLVVTLGQLAIAKFSNPSGLLKTAGNTFQESINSGTADISIAGDGRGTIRSGSLEMSNVDLSEEFTEMIVTQRAFQSNTKVITTSDEILQELVNLKR